jgi:hypothetical protein
MFLLVGALDALPRGLGLLVIPFAGTEVMAGLLQGLRVAGRWREVRIVARVGLGALWLSGWVAWLSRLHASKSILTG